MISVMTVVGARPNLMKAAPLVKAMAASGAIRPVLVHTGQHYDEMMNDIFFRELGIPKPDHHLGVGSGSHAEQTGRIMSGMEQLLEANRPDLLVVVGDVNSTMAATLVAAKAMVPVAHVEAGLRSFDRAMPEEINRIVTDSLADALFTTSRQAGENLRREGHPEARIFFVGNVMIDTLLAFRERAAASDILARLGLAVRGYALLTLHRPSNVDDRAAMGRILQALREVGKRLPILFPAHPRTTRRLAEFGYGPEALGAVRTIEPLGYIDFLRLTTGAALVLTDSGGVQEETTVLGVPCVTLRENTERPETVSEGTNVLVGNDPGRILAAARAALDGEGPRGRVPELWDGKAAGRIVELIRDRFSR